MKRLTQPLSSSSGNRLHLGFSSNSSGGKAFLTAGSNASGLFVAPMTRIGLRRHSPLGLSSLVVAVYLHTHSAELPRDNTAFHFALSSLFVLVLSHRSGNFGGNYRMAEDMNCLFWPGCRSLGELPAH